VIQRYLEMNPHDNRALLFGATQLCIIGEQEKALEMAERALGQDENEPNLLYNGACFYALQVDIDRSLELLARAVELGWGNRDWLETDSDLDSLRADHRFIALLKGMHCARRETSSSFSFDIRLDFDGTLTDISSSFVRLLWVSSSPSNYINRTAAFERLPAARQ